MGKVLGYIANLQKGFKAEYQKNQPESIKPKIDDNFIAGTKAPRPYQHRHERL